MIKQIPLVFKPYLKSVIWGGNKICTYKNIKCDEKNIGESWEISAVPGHESIVEEGPYKGMSITQLIDTFKSELLGQKVVDRYGLSFPLLIKIIDAADNLSVQVHPDDDLARTRHNSLGKTEMWYIIDAEKNAKIFAGLNTSMTPDDYVQRVADGSFAETLAVHDSSAGDVFFLPAGRVHAIGAGNLLAEIQESSDITYRIYDYDRRDKNGNTRELHTDLAKDAIDYNVYPNYKNASVDDAVADCQIVSCSHFAVRRVKVNGRQLISLCEGSFSVVMCLDGSIKLSAPDGAVELSAGHTALIPAAVKTLQADGKATLLVANS